MVQWLMHWKWTEQYNSLPAEERLKVSNRIVEMGKARAHPEKSKALGRTLTGVEGYSISEHSETEILEFCTLTRPYVSWEIIPLISREQAGEITVKARALREKST